MAASEKKIIRFEKVALPYGPGDIAAFSPEEAARYVKGGRAVYCDKDGKEIVAPKAEEKPKAGAPAAGDKSSK